MECENKVFFKPMNKEVSATQRGRQYCPFGNGEQIVSENIFKDQKSIEPRFVIDVPQMDPRPLVRIGTEFRN